MDNSRTPKNQEELNARIEAANRRQESWDAESFMGMLAGRCLDGSFSPLMLHYRYITKDWMHNPMGSAHGGIIAAIFDNAMGITAFIVSPYGGPAPTAELHISYLKPVPLNAALHVRVFADQIGSRLIRTRAELRVEGEDAVYATATAASCPIR